MAIFLSHFLALISLFDGGGFVGLSFGFINLLAKNSEFELFENFKCFS